MAVALDRRVRRENGFTLVEVAIAMALLATALVALAQLGSTTIASNVAARYATAASLLASAKLEELRSSPLPPSDGTDAGIGFVRRWTVRAFPGSTVGTHVIAVDVEMTGAGGVATRLVAATRW